MRCRYITSKGKAERRFARHVSKVLDCAINYHSSRWTADNNLETTSGNYFTLGVVAKTIPFVTASKVRDYPTGRPNSFSIKSILKEKGIPEEFQKVTFRENKREFPEMKSIAAETLAYNTSILLPHHKDVEAVLFLQKVEEEFTNTFLPRAKADLLDIKQRQVQEGVDDSLVHCDQCQKWRKVYDEAVYVR